MSVSYLHHVEGRLRVRVPALRRDEGACDAARRALAMLDGVAQVETRALTGSVTVRYDADRLTPDAILGELRRCGYLGEGSADPASAGEGWPALEEAVGKVIAAVAKTATESVLERALGRAATALIMAMA